MNDIIISSIELREKNAFALPQKAGDLSQSNFWYYTSLSTADKILQSKQIHISNIKNMNDKDEKLLHKQDMEKVHCLCFCNSNSEKIPMWYLYSGIAGKGAAIKFTPAVLLGLLNSIEVVSVPNLSTELYKGRDFDIEFGWVYYRKKEDKTQVNYKRKWFSLIDPDNFEEGNYFIKAYPWEYEREFRIVIHNKTDAVYDRLAIDISPVYKKLQIKLAPELTVEEFKEVLPILLGFNQFYAETVLHSNLGINMDLCKRNLDSFTDFIETQLSHQGNRLIDNQQLSKLQAVMKQYVSIGE